MTSKTTESADAKHQRWNTTICECGHSQAWHYGKMTHIGHCRFPDCQCRSFKGGENEPY